MNSSKSVRNAWQKEHNARYILGIIVSSTFALGLGTSSAVHAQATGGSIFGWGPAGQTVSIHSSTGLRRHTTIKDSGRYSLKTLPLGVYNVSLEKGGASVDERKNIKLTVGGGAEVDFACPKDQCTAVAK